jgi:serine/threonine-protein kinase RsbW
MSNTPSDKALHVSSSENSEQSIELAARFDNLEQIRDFVGRQANRCGLSEKAIYQVQLAVDEAFTNVVEHAYGGECDESIECSCQINARGLVVTLRDCGQIFDPSEVPGPDLDARLEERGVGGLGLYFIRQLMDEVNFSFATDSGKKRECNILRMVKYKENTN